MAKLQSESSCQGAEVARLQTVILAPPTITMHARTPRVVISVELFSTRIKKRERSQ